MGTLDMLRESAKRGGVRPMTDAEEHALIQQSDREDAERAAYAKEALERLANQVTNVAAKRAQHVAPRPEPLANPAQDRFFASLVNRLRQSGLQEFVEVGWKASEWAADLQGKHGGIPKRLVSTAIDRLKVHVKAMEIVQQQAAPAAKPAVPPNTGPDVEDGRYALRGDDGIVRFYHVKHSKRTGRAYAQIKAGDELHFIEWYRGGREVLAKIAEAPEAAQVLYGRELGECYACGRDLTDELSRSLGIGPVCRTKGA